MADATAVGSPARITQLFATHGCELRAIWACLDSLPPLPGHKRG